MDDEMITVLNSIKAIFINCKTKSVSMKKLTYYLLCLFISIGVATAQTTRVTGTVASAEDGEPVIGASIVVKGTTVGTVTTFDGTFSLDGVPQNASTIVISYLGMKTQEVAISPIINVRLSSDSQALDEVVVTALGISREKKSLGYAVQEVKSDELTKGGQMNVLSSLAGKVAGVQINAAGGQVGASQRIVIRGNSSLGDNEPLIVVDGVPISNDQSKSDRAVDYGSGLNDINPEDIESISVLKGGSAALYGMRAGNGVVLITTKSGKNTEKGVEVRYDGNFTFDNMYNIPKMQNKYGAGYEGSEYDYAVRQAKGFVGSYQDFASRYGYNFDSRQADESWGPRLDVGLMLPQVNSPIGPDGKRIPTPWVSQPNNIKDFIETGYSMNHNVSFTNRSEHATTRASIGYRQQKGTIPNTDQKRYSAQLNTTYNINKYFDYDLSMNYTKTKSDNLPKTGYYAGNPLQSMLQWFGRQVDMKDQKANWDKIDEATGKPYSWNPNYHQNPYYTMNKNLNPFERDRLFGKTSLHFKPLEYLRFEGRLGFDYYNMKRSENITYTTDEPYGYFRHFNDKQTEINADIIAFFDKRFGDLSVNVIAGANYRDMSWEQAVLGANQLTQPGLFTPANVRGAVHAIEDHRHIRTNSVYGNASFGYKSMLYVDVSARNDWDSTIDDSFFYPSVSASWIPTSTFEDLQSDYFNFLKLRGGWAKIGSATQAYYNRFYFSIVDSPIKNVTQFYLPWTYPPDNLKPESVQTWEIGLEAQFLQNRLGLDIAYYKKKTTDQILEVAVSKATGYRHMLVNAGEIRNKGMEIQLTGTPIQTKDWQWNATLNWSKDKGEIVDIYTDPLTGQSLQQYEIGSEWSTYVYAIPGQGWGTIWGSGMIKDDNGNYIVGANGLPSTRTQAIGDVSPKWLASFRNEISWKDLSLSFMLDYRRGGDVFSVTQMWATYTGQLDYTAAGDIRERPIVVGKDVLADMGTFVKADGTPNDIETDAMSFFYSYYSSNRQLSVFDGSFLKLREVSVTYTFPRQLLQKTKYIKAANVSLIGNNLAILWLHSSNKAKIDPESNKTSGNDGVGLESGGYMPSRSIGLKVGITF